MKFILVHNSFNTKAAFTLSKFSWSKSIKENLVKVFLDEVDRLHYQKFFDQLVHEIDGKCIKM